MKNRRINTIHNPRKVISEETYAKIYKNSGKIDDKLLQKKDIIFLCVFLASFLGVLTL